MPRAQAITTGFQVGDLVQARRDGVGDNGATQHLVTEFTVTNVAGSRLMGSVFFPQGMDASDGWGFELIARTLALPTALSEVDAVRFDDQIVRLIGKGDKWIDESTGHPARIADFKAFTVVTS